MKCPIDNTELVMADRQGIEIDYCPQCRGIWLDRGELDKIIERTQVAAAPPASANWGQPQGSSHDDGHGRGGHGDHGRGHGDGRDQKGRRRSGLLGDIFDF